MAQPVFAASDVVLRASNVKTIHGNWYVAYDSSAAGGEYLASTDYGWSTTSTPVAQPNDYLEFSFYAPANIRYHVWFRLRARSNSKYNDSVWVQYSDSLTAGGSPVYRIGTTSGLDVNLERCSGCGVSGWGWQDGAYWLSETTVVEFASDGTHTLRIQTREDGVEIDQIVISPQTYLYSSPGAAANDTTIVPLSGGATTTSTTGPFLGSPVTIPGRIQGENFDNGPDGVSYHDTTSGNIGGAYRQTNVDIQPCSEGGYNVGWIDPGEWLNYSVNVTAAGSYMVKLRVASPNGAALHLGFNGPSSVWKYVSIPASGGWQNWTTVSVPVSLGAGRQLMTLLFDTNDVNLNYVDVATGTTSSGTTSATTGTTSSGLAVVTWNVRISSDPSRARQAIADLMTLSPRPRVIVLQEVFGASYGTYLSELQSRTGQTWQGAFRSHCPPGAWNGSSCSWSEQEGVAVFTSLPVVNTSSTLLPYADQWHSARALVRVAVNYGGVIVHVFGAHLPLNATSRYGAMSMIKSYARNYAAPQIVGGDFNADQDQIDTTSGMYPNFTDTWKLVGSGHGFTANSPSPTMKLDYLFADASGRARPDWAVVLANFGTFSNHFAVYDSFTIR